MFVILSLWFGLVTKVLKDLKDPCMYHTAKHEGSDEKLHRVI